jgi:hypothetical protein
MCRLSYYAIFGFVVSLAGLPHLMAQSKPPGQVRLDVYVFTCSRDLLAKTRLAINEDAAYKLAHLTAQESETLLKIVHAHKNSKVVAEPRFLGPNAEPEFTIDTISGKPVTLVSGSRIVVTSDENQHQIRLLDVGLKLTLLPKVQELGNVYLEMTPTILTIDEGLGITVAGENVPGLQEQEVKLSIDLNSDQWAGLSLITDPTGYMTKDRVTLILVKPHVSPSPPQTPVVSPASMQTPAVSPAPTQIPLVPMAPASHVDSAKRIAAMLVEEYHAACRDQNTALATKLARQALELDPTCFHDPATPSAPAISR